MRKEELKKSRQYKDFVAKKRYLQLSASWCVRFDLSPTELMIFAYIRHMTESGAYGRYTGSIKGLCALCNITLPTARAAVEKLKDKGFLRKCKTIREDRNWISYEATITSPIITAANFRGESIEDLLASEQARRKVMTGIRP